MPGWITSKLLGFVSGGLLLAAIGSGVFGWVQTSRLGAATETIKDLRATLDAKASEIVLLTQRITSDRQLIEVRDRLIERQNAAVLAMQASAQAERQAYEQRIAAADRLARTHEARARDILARETAATDELERSREALRLILEEVEGPAQ